MLYKKLFVEPSINQFDNSDIVIHDINMIQYHQDVIHPIEFTLQVKDLSSLWDYRWVF